MKTVSIGHMTKMGDLAVIATLNNNHEVMTDQRFNELVQELAITIANYTGVQILTLERQDTPNFVDIETYDEHGVNTRNSFNTPPKED